MTISKGKLRQVSSGRSKRVKKLKLDGLIAAYCHMRTAIRLLEIRVKLGEIH